ncbi:MAG: hypothetical protein VX922_08175 [Candidatus Neomarinimicrobiota bacterium]|nr:hypothetical protein [Candidatus Neomarinimicrobiota bacterium]
MDFSFLKPVDLWFWFFFIISFIIIVYTLIFIKNHSEIKFLIILRSITFLIFTFLLLKPKFSWTQYNYNNLDWNLYIDNSVSISYHPLLSFQTIKSELEQIIYSIIKKDAFYNLFSFSGNIKKIKNTESFDSSGSSTDIGKVLNHIELNQDNLAGAVIISDGQNNNGINPKSLIKNIKVPVYTLGIGETKPLIDLSIESVDAPTVAVKGENVSINATINSYGNLDEKVNVVLYSGKKMIGSKFLNISGQGSRNEARFIFTPLNLGENEYIVKVSSLSEEINIDNNQQKFLISVLKDHYKVALITGAPSFNTIVIKEYITNYPRVELDHYVLSNNGYTPSLKLFWSTPYQLIIFDNYPIDVLKSKTQKIYSKKITSEKASLLWIIGQNITSESAQSLTPFFHLDYVDENINSDKNSWYFTEDIINSSIIQGSLTNQKSNFADIFPPITTPYKFNAKHKKVNPIAYHESDEVIPVIFMGDVKNIRSIVWTSNDFSTVKYNISSNNNFRDIWSNLFSWLLKTGGDRNLYFRLNKESYQQGEEILITGSSIQDNLSINNQAFIAIMDDSMEVNSFELRFNPESNRWEGNFWAPKPGNYNYKIVINDRSSEPMEQIGKFIVEKSQIELNQVSLNLPLLTNISNGTGAEYYSWESRSVLVDKIKPVKNKTKIDKSVVLSENKWVMIILIILLTIEWVFRKRIGLP